MRTRVRDFAIVAAVGLVSARLVVGCAGAQSDENAGAGGGGASGPGAGGTATNTAASGNSTTTSASSTSGMGGASASSASTTTNASSGVGGATSSASSSVAASSSVVASSSAIASSSVASTGAGMDGGLDLDAGCALFSADAQLAPAAMLVVVDKSSSMNNNNKWAAAQTAVVAAIDKDIFDSMSLGLVAFPTSYDNPPACLCFGLPQAECNALYAPGVSCGTSALPQVAIAPAGLSKSNAPSGVRHDMYQYLANNSPLNNSDDGSPIYDALVSGYNALKGYNIDKRMLILITDGGFSCTSISSPLRMGYSDGECPDWEEPPSVNALITAQRTDPNTPILTFIVGVPGSNSTGQDIGGFATPPYNMELAMSTYAVSGSPTTVDPACDSAAVFTQGGAAPAVPCHIDLSNGNMFDANALGAAIAKARGQALGCVYDLPPPPMNQVIDPNLVNVEIIVDGVTIVVPRRVDPLDMCLVSPCWDYNPSNQVVIIGAGCTDLTSAMTAKVDIVVGCETIHE